MRVYVTAKGTGKTELIIDRALYSAAENQNSNIVVVCQNQKKASAVKKEATKKNGGILPKNIEFVGADVFFSKGPSRSRKTLPVRFFFDDLDEILKNLCEKITGGKAIMEFASATDDDLKGGKKDA